VSSEHEADAGVSAATDRIDPTAVVATMASAVERLRHQAAAAFGGDPALFADPPPDAST
jgi:hypothetical protein